MSRPPVRRVCRRAEIVREAVLELTYTTHDMAPFARDMGHVDEASEVLPPFCWEPDPNAPGEEEP